MAIQAQPADSIPVVWPVPASLDRTAVSLRDKAKQLAVQREGLCSEDTDVPSWIRKNLNLGKAAIGALDMKIIQSYDAGDFVVQAILFQSLKGVYVPANLYIPKGEGPFPAVINSHGHWPDAKQGQIVQQTAQLLAKNGYVCLNMDAWGAGERGTNHVHEYHGSSLGASLMDLGIPLMGMQLLDNQSGIDLLQSLSFVDPSRIGATGASGGGNQTLWLTALDQRIRAAVPVVSVGTFEAYIMNSNCVCELHPNGLLTLEKADVIASMAPRSVKILTALRDRNAAFNVQEMLKTYRRAKLQYQLLDHADCLSYELYDEEHSYTEEMQLSMLAWFNRFLKGKEEASQGFDFQLLDSDVLKVATNAENKRLIATTRSYLKEQGRQMQADFLQIGADDYPKKLGDLKDLLGGYKSKAIQQVNVIDSQLGFKRVVLEDSAGDLLPLAIKEPELGSNTIRLFFPSRGIARWSKQREMDWRGKAEGLVFVDLFGLGERSSNGADAIDGRLPRFHTLSRSMLWMGESMMATWLSEMAVVLRYIRDEFPDAELELVADRETAIAALLYAVVEQDKIKLILNDLPLSFVPDRVEADGVEAINMAVHLQGIIPWGDVLGLIGFAPAEVSIMGSIGMSGQKLEEGYIANYASCVSAFREKLGNTSKIIFN